MLTINAKRGVDVLPALSCAMLLAPMTASPQEAETQQGEQIIVSGSRIPTKSPEGPQEVQVYTAETIERSGQATVVDFLNTLPGVSLIVDPGSLQTGNIATGVRLHGLPLGTALVLIDGRRIQNSSTAAFNDIFDLTFLPLAVVDRIEVLPQGSSAIYGSDGIAGVVNIILKKNFEGFAGSARYGAADRTSEFNTSLAWGGRWDRAAFSVVGGFLTQSELTGKERPLTADANYTRFGSTDRRLTVGNPGNVFSVNGSNLPGLNAPYAAVPAGFTGTPSRSEFAATAGTLNKFSEFSEFALIPESNRIGLLANGTYDLTSSTQLFAQLLYSRVDQDQHLLPNGFLNGSPGFQSYKVSAANPFNPFGETVGIGYFFPGVYLDASRTNYFLPSLGVKGHLTESWTWELTAWDSLDNTEKAISGQPRPAPLQAALNSSNPATALNPFVAGAPGSQQLVDSVLYTDDEKYHGNSFSTSALLRGTVVTLPGGDLSVALGSEFTRQILHVEDDAGGPNPYGFSSVGRNDHAAYGEARVPIIGPRADQRDDVFAITGAQRYDHYDEFGGKWTNQFGGELRPLADLLLRADWGRAFKAPSLYQLNVPQVITQQGIVDPLTGKTSGATVIAGGNPNLKPETGDSHSFGFVYSDGLIRGLDVSVTNWVVKLYNSIQSLNAQVIVNNAGLFPGAVVRAPSCAGGPPCPIVSVNRTFTNFGDINVSGLDYLITYRLSAGGIQWTPSVSATQTYRYLVAFQPGQPATDRAGQANDDLNWAPRWKGAAMLAVEKGPLSGALAGRYVGSYRDYDKLANGTYPHIGSIWYADFNLRYQLDSLSPGTQWLRRMAAEIGGVNIFDRQPQFSTLFSGAYGFDILQADMRGRFLYVQLDKRL